jgi:ABC-type branched-subunit amino acid transport system substrate-binding protein
MVPSILLCLCAGFCSVTKADPGVSSNQVRLAVLMPLSSDFAEVGMGYLRGAEVAAEHINQLGGIQGRKLRLEAVDTLTVPAETLSEAKDTLRAGPGHEPPFAMLGTLGKASASALAPLLQSAGVPLIGPGTGLYSDIATGRDWIFPVRQGDEQVMRRMVNQLETMSLKRLAVIHPRSPDSLLQMGFLRDGLKNGKLALVSEVDVGDTNMEIAPQIAVLIAAKPDVILTLGSYLMTQALITQMRAAGYKGLFLTHSDVGISQLLKSMKEGARGLGVVSGLPSPHAQRLIAAQEFRKAFENSSVIHQTGEAIVLDESAFEGYLSVMVFCEALRTIGGQPTRRELREALASKPMSVSGLVFDFTRTSARGLQNAGDISVVTYGGKISQ